MQFSFPFSLRHLDVADFCTPKVFQQNKSVIWAHLSAEKKVRQVFLHNHCQVLFESAFLVWFQIQEMLRVEPEAQPADELSVYEPLIPTPDRLTLTLMFEFPDVPERHKKLAELAGFEKSLSLCFGHHKIEARFVDENHDDLEKASAVNFLYFPLLPAQIHDFCQTSEAFLQLQHPACPSTVHLSTELLARLQQERQPNSK